MTGSGLSLDDLDFERGGGFVTVIAQDAATGDVLMVARADREAVARTLASREMHYHSRRRGLWLKGEESGNRQHVVALHADCDGDAVLATVVPTGPACHTGAWSCFPNGGATLRRLDAVIAARAAAAAAGDASGAGPAPLQPGYTGRLLRDRNLRLKKVGEEAAEFCVACADGDAPAAVAEAADLLYHVLVALRGVGAGLDDVVTCLAGRRDGARDVSSAP